MGEWQPEFSSTNQPARRGRKPKAIKFAKQFAEFDSDSGALFGAALKVYKQVLEGEYLQPMMNNKTGTVELVGPTADQALKAADAIVNRIMGKAASHKEVDVNIERQDTMVILTGDAAAELRALRRRVKELEAGKGEAIEAGYSETPALPAPAAPVSAASAVSPAPAASAAPASSSVSAAYLPPTDASSASFSPVPASERKVTSSRVKGPEGD
jgi:hypothetical protein